MTHAYNPDFFDAPDLDAARALVLTPEHGYTTDERWHQETEFLLDKIGQTARLGAGSVVLDYGCGVGRLAKGLIDRYGCAVVGVDISSPMRAYAVEYVHRDKFMVLHPAMLPLLGRGFADLALAIWVLQHCFRPRDDLRAISAALRPTGRLFVVNEYGRCIPSSTDKLSLVWTTDHVDVRDLLAERFRVEKEGKFNNKFAEHTYVNFYRCKGNGSM